MNGRKGKGRSDRKGGDMFFPSFPFVSSSICGSIHTLCFLSTLFLSSPFYISYHFVFFFFFLLSFSIPFFLAIILLRCSLFFLFVMFYPTCLAFVLHFLSSFPTGSHVKSSSFLLISLSELSLSTCFSCIFLASPLPEITCSGNLEIKSD